MDPCSQTCAQVGGTCEDIAKSLIPHELPALLLDQMLHLKHITTQDISAFSTFLHHYLILNSHMKLLDVIRLFVIRLFLI